MLLATLIHLSSNNEHKYVFETIRQPWRGAKEKIHVVMQQLIEACSPLHGCVLDLSVGTGASFNATK